MTCVDRSYPDAPSLAQLEIVVERGLVTWVMAAAPLAGWRPAFEAEQATIQPTALYWPMPETCFPYFPERHPSYLTAAQKNLAVRFEWVNDTDLLSLQAWQDDNETGYFVLLREDGRPATVGYRFEGLAHGVWYYLRPDSTLAEARLYALGVLLEQLPVETTPYARKP